MELFETIAHKDNVHLNMDVQAEPKTLSQFIEYWRVKIWDKAFVNVFKRAEAFKKSIAFKEFKGSDLVVKRVVYRYFFFLSNLIYR